MRRTPAKIQELDPTRPAQCPTCKSGGWSRGRVKIYKNNVHRVRPSGSRNWRRKPTGPKDPIRVYWPVRFQAKRFSNTRTYITCVDKWHDIHLDSAPAETTTEINKHKEQTKDRAKLHKARQSKDKR